jgi:hypothetical protein
MNKQTLIATAALAVAAIAPAAAQAGTVGGYLAQNPSTLPSAADAQYRVPAGKVEHRVTFVKVSGTKALASNERQELWLSATRSRMVVKNAVTGKVRVEIVDRPGETRIYDAERNRVTIMRSKSKTPAYTSAAFESALYRAYVQQGIMKVAGEQIVDGRKLLTLESVAGKWKSSDPGSRATALVDAETFAVKQIASILDGGLFNQTVDNKLTETLDAGRASSAKLAMAKHATAKVTRKGH